MAFITSPFILRVQNAADVTVVPVTRILKFSGGLVVTQVAPGKADVNGGGGPGGFWNVIGNAGGGLVLGTTTNDTYNFIQDNQSRGGFNTLGQFFLKTHSTFPGSELQIATAAVQTIDGNPQFIYILSVPDQSVGQFKARIQGRKSDGTGRAAFERSFLFYREGANATLTPKFQSDFTDKSDDDYNVTVVASGTDVVVRVTGKTGETLNWSGTFEYQLIQ